MNTVSSELATLGRLFEDETFARAQPDVPPPEVLYQFLYACLEVPQPLENDAAVRQLLIGLAERRFGGGCAGAVILHLARLADPASWMAVLQALLVSDSSDALLTRLETL